MTDTGTAARPGTVMPDLLAVVGDALAVICERPAGTIAGDTSLEELGADSLARVELAEIVEERLAGRLPGLHIDDADLAAFASVADVVAYLQARL